MVDNRQPMREHTGLSLGIAATIVMFFVVFAALLVVTIYSFITVYAIVKAIGSAPTCPLVTLSACLDRTLAGR